jgi:hypothetical protein
MHRILSLKPGYVGAKGVDGFFEAHFAPKKFKAQLSHPVTNRAIHSAYIKSVCFIFSPLLKAFLKASNG